MSSDVKKTNDDINASDNLVLMARVAVLEEENYRLRLANALLKWKPEPKKRGRPEKQTLKSDIQLLELVEKLKVDWKLSSRRAVLRKVQGTRSDGKYRSKTKLEQEVATLEKVLSVASKVKKTSNK